MVYQHFGDRDTLLLEAGLDLARRELLPRLAETPQSATGREQALAVARHFANHRRVLPRAADRTLRVRAQPRADRPAPAGQQAGHIGQLYGDRLTPQATDDLAAFLTGGADSFVTTWVVEGGDPLDPEAFTDRLMTVMSALMAAMSRIDDTTDREDSP